VRESLLCDRPTGLALLRNHDPAGAIGEPLKNKKIIPRRTLENAICCATMIPRAQHPTYM
jgi:hypothetical protein